MAERFAILNPCSKRWQDLTGEGRKRFCPNCQTYIHAIEQYSAEEIEDLRRESLGRLCGYLKGESVLQPRSQRAVLVGAALTVISPLMAQSGQVRIRVMDLRGAAIPSAEASILGNDGNPALTGRANQLGEIVLTGLPIGDSKVRVTCAGFMTLPRIVTIRNSDEVKVDARLGIGWVGVGTVVELEPVRPASVEPPRKSSTWCFPRK